MNLGQAGVWLGSMANLPAAKLRDAVIEIEAMGFGTIWIGEAIGREPFAASALILSSTSHVTVATGIANIWVRDATAMMNGARTLAEAWPNRFVLGIGVSHVPLVDARGHQYERPLSAMRAYLEAMGNAPYRATMPDPPPITLCRLCPGAEPPSRWRGERDGRLGWPPFRQNGGQPRVTLPHRAPVASSSWRAPFSTWRIIAGTWSASAGPVTNFSHQEAIVSSMPWSPGVRMR